MINKNLKILVVCGGISTEREVSLKSGRAVFNALLRLGYMNVQLFDLRKDNMVDIFDIKPDIVYLALHGKGGEDGCIQGVLELAGIRYTGPGVACSAICMDKIMTKRVIENAGLPTAKFVVRRKDECDDLSLLTNQLIDEIGLPMVLKSPSQGSSIGVVIVRTKEDIRQAVQEVFKYGEYLLVEQYLDGTEVTLPIMGNNEPFVLPIVEITSEREFYDFTAKYTSGLCRHIIPACVESNVEKEIIDIGKKAYAVLNCKGLSRIDFIIDRHKGPMIIEVNTLPGMTDMSLFPDSARYIGISYEDLVERILEYGLTISKD